MQLLIGTSNKGKIVEMAEALSGLGIEIITPLQLGITDVPHEEGSTFAENARQKALFYHQQSGLPTLADDSGILVEALHNELGIHTRRWGAGPDASDHHWITFFLDRMRGEKNKRARFICSLCYIDESGTAYLFEGVCDGTITDELEADFLPGLPISACFKPEGYVKVYSGLSIEEKNAVSHRGKAMRSFITHIRNIIPA
jgi:XTP/dITP diphosphohydrolase